MDQDRELLKVYIRESLNESWSDVGHIVLDVAGFIPGVGEAFDATNAAWYAAQGNYISAALSLISCIPELGDIIGKGGKVALWLSKAGKAGQVAGKAGQMIVKIAKLIKANRTAIDKVFAVARKNKKLGPYVEKMNDSLGEFVNHAVSTTANQKTPQPPQKQPSQNAPAPKPANNVQKKNQQVATV